MLFQTPEFLVLFLLVLLGIHCLRTRPAQHSLLLLTSFVFYGWTDVRYLVLLIITAMVDYSAALGIEGVRLRWSQKCLVPAVVLLGGLICLVPNWSLLQSHHQPADQIVTPSMIFTTGWKGQTAALLGCLAYAVVAPLVYELLIRLPEKQRRVAFLATSMFTNLGMLAFFKYYNFFMQNFYALAHGLGFDVKQQFMSIELPPGISFYTFQSMSYSIDVYRRHDRAERSLLRMLAFVSYFPHLVAGPILNPSRILPALDRVWTLHGPYLISGFHLVLVGLCKKVLIADNIARLTEVLLGNPIQEQRSSIMIVLGTVLFAVQIYGDFSGYTDIARGISRMMGVEIPLNFDYPYFSTSIIEFWRRWHISLSSWLRDYLYVPLGGNRGSVGRTYFNLMTTMVLGGLWHGASWNFVLWGAYQGGLLCLNRALRTRIDASPTWKARLEWPLFVVLRWGVTFYLVLFGWLLFRITSFPDLWYAARKFVFFDGNLALGSQGIATAAPFTALLALGIFAVLHTIGFSYRRWADTLDALPPRLLWGVYAGLGFLFFFAWPGQNAPFIYFQF